MTKVKDATAMADLCVRFNTTAQAIDAILGRGATFSVDGCRYVRNEHIPRLETAFLRSALRNQVPNMTIRPQI